MCGIIYTSHREQIPDLVKLNERRGNGRFSVMVRVGNKDTFFNDGDVDINDIITKIPDDMKFCIIHIQAQTSNHGNYHPAVHKDNMLWHNGMLKDTEVKRWAKNDLEREWDTAILARIGVDWETLSDIEGTFACLCYAQDNLWIYRNELVPLYGNDDWSIISSTKFQNSNLIPCHGIFCKVNGMGPPMILQGASFVTKNSPYRL